MNPVDPKEASETVIPEQPETPVSSLWQRWRQERCPDFSDPAAGGLSADQALAILRYDQCQRWQAGERVPAERYLQTYTILKTDRDQALVLIYGEFLLRQELGESPTLDEYLQRFPECAERLRQQDEFHRAMEGVSWLDPVDAALPKQAGVCRLVGEIARGGMGMVLKGHDQRLGRDLAVKVLRDEYKDRPDVVRRFLEEAQVSGQLQHPGIVPVHEVGQFEDGRPYFTMKLVQGRTLGNLLSERKPVGQVSNLPGADQAGWKPALQDLPRFLKIFEQMCQTLAYAHSKGVIHRDVKPANVMVGAFGEVQVMDWGLAKQRDKQTNRQADTKAPLVPKLPLVGKLELGNETPTPSTCLYGEEWHTQPGQAVGTPAYMAPEQARGEGSILDERCDVFGLGAVLCEILTGQPPYVGQRSLDILDQAKRCELDGALARLDGCGADAELLQLAKACLAPAPQDRPRDAGVVAERATAYLAGVQERLRRAEVERAAAQARAQEEARTRQVAEAKAAVERRARRLTVGLAAAVLLLVVFGGGGLWYNAEQRAATVKTLGEAQDLLERKHKEIEDIELRGKETAWRYQYVADMLVAPAAWETNDVGRLRQLLKSYQPRRDRPDVRGFEWFYFWRLAHAERLTLADQGGPIACVTVSPDGKLIASGSRNGSMFLWDAATGHLKHKLLGTSRAIRGVAFSPDGAALAVASDNGVNLWDHLADKPQRQALSATWESFSCVVFTPDGATLVAGTTGGAVKMWDVKTRAETPSFPAHKTGILTMAFSHDGKTLATGSSDRRVRLWELSALEPRAELQGHPVSVTALAFSSNDASVATASQDGTVYVWDAATGKRRAGPFYPHRGDINALAYTADDKALITGSTDRTVRVSDAATGQERLIFKGHELAVTCLVLADQGKALVTGSQDKTVKVWDVAGTHQETVLPRQSGAATCVAWSPDGKTLACGGQEKTEVGGSISVIEVWDPAKKTNVVWRGHDGEVTDVAFSPDGATLASASVDHTVLLWDVAKGKVLFKLQSHDAPVSCLTFSRDGKWLASADVNGHVILWDPSAGKEVKPLPGYKSPVRCLAFSPDRTTLAGSHGDGTVVLWDVHAATQLCLWQAHGKGIYGLSFSPDGATLATGSDDRSAKLWDWAAQREVASFTDHEKEVRGLAFAPDGRTLVTAAGSVRLWDVATRMERAALRSNTHSALRVAFSRDGRRLAAGTYNGPLVVWDGATDEELSRIRD